MRKVIKGDFVETIHGVNGILIDVKNGYYGPTAFIETSDSRIFYCPVTEFKNCEYTDKAGEQE